MDQLAQNVLLSFARSKREVPAERIEDNIVASKKKSNGQGTIHLSAIVRRIVS